MTTESLTVVWTAQTEPTAVSWSSGFNEDIAQGGPVFSDNGWRSKPPHYGLWRWTGERIELGEMGSQLMGKWTLIAELDHNERN